ncbi:MAG TPA: hypothetical protein DCQ31_00540 [Bacteroidales bacterium]|nr:hypothetical protein [Bacteroidales bacterium]
MNDSPNRLFVLFFILLIEAFSTFAVPANGIIIPPDSLEESNIRIAEIIIVGNERTKDFIIHRELLFRVGSVLQEQELSLLVEKSKINLSNTSLFNFVSITPVYLTENKISIQIVVEERWYFWPDVYFDHADRNLSSWLYNKDWSRVFYGLGFTKLNFRGRNERLRVSVVAGYFQRVVLGYNNLVLDSHRKHLINIYAESFRQHGLSYNTYNNKEIGLRYDESFIFQRNKVEISYDYRQKVNISHRIGLSGNQTFVHDSILKLNINYTKSTQNNYLFFQLYYRLTYENRDNKTYPLKGNYVDFNAIFTNFGAISGNSNSQFFSIYYSQFAKPANRLYFGGNTQAFYTFGPKAPDYFTTGLGYRAFLRGFDYYIIPSKDYIMLKTNLKYELITPKIGIISFIKSPKFSKIHYAAYINLIADAGYASFPNSDIPQITLNTLANKPIFSYGLGFDLVTYYDKVLRFEYVINSKNEAGFFFHFEAGIR